MITTTTIVELCRKEEDDFEHFERYKFLNQVLEDARFAALAEEFGCKSLDAVQLACEAIKFHMMRLDGHTYEAAIERMIGVRLA